MARLETCLIAGDNPHWYNFLSDSFRKKLENLHTEITRKSETGVSLDQSLDNESTVETAADYSTREVGGNQEDVELTLEARLEALLFASAHPATVGQLSNALQVTSRKVKISLETLENSLSSRGIRMQKHGAGYQLTTAPDVAADLERLLNLEDTSRLSRAALEAIAIIAYQQPVTRPQIDSIRGVNSDSVLRTLLRHGLIEETGRSMSPGRPILYSTTPEFLQHFGLSNIKDLPPLDPDLISEINNSSEASIEEA
jgi:segregation and condensation protein B